VSEAASLRAAGVARPNDGAAGGFGPEATLDRVKPGIDADFARSIAPSASRPCEWHLTRDIRGLRAIGSAPKRRFGTESLSSAAGDPTSRDDSTAIVEPQSSLDAPAAGSDTRPRRLNPAQRSRAWVPMRAGMPRLVRRILPVALVVAASAASAPSALAACGDADAPAASPGAVSATLCLLNEQRAAHGLRAFSESTVLDRAAGGYAQDMVDDGFFDHVSPSGGTMLERIKSAGWVPAGAWTAGENIAWGSGTLSTPASIVDGWMHSAGHRANILNGSFGQIGIGIAAGAPQDVEGAAGTYVTDFTGGSSSAKRAVAKCAVRARVALIGQRKAAKRCATRR
jgi:uncharacterized protein YkwD